MEVCSRDLKGRNMQWAFATFVLSVALRSFYRVVVKHLMNCVGRHLLQFKPQRRCDNLSASHELYWSI